MSEHHLFPGSLLRGREKLRNEATHIIAYLLGVISPSSLASIWCDVMRRDQHGTGTAWEYGYSREGSSAKFISLKIKHIPDLL